MKPTVRQQEIVEAARSIITLKGMESLTIRELAKELKLTEGAIYRHFKSKNQIIELLIDDIEKTLLAAVGQGAAGNEDPAEKLRNVFTAHLSYVEKRNGVSFSIINETINIKDERLRKHMLSVVNAYLIKIEGLLTEGVKSGQFRKNINTASGSVAFFGMVQSLVTLWALSGYKHSILTAHLPALFDLYIKGVIKQ